MFVTENIIIHFYDLSKQPPFSVLRHLGHCSKKMCGMDERGQASQNQAFVWRIVQFDWLLARRNLPVLPYKSDQN